jgi:hypothetical protein
MCDIGVAELGMSFLMYGSVGEFCAMELPFIHNCKVIDYEGKYPYLYENNHADSEESVLKHFENFISNKDIYIERAVKTNEWFMKYIINEPLEKIIFMIKEHKKNLGIKRFFHNVWYFRIYKS